MSHKTYFAMPSFDYPPDHSIELGQIITSPSEPWSRLSEPLPVSENSLQRNVKTDWGTEVHRMNEQHIGVWAQFAAMIVGVGADAIVSWSRDKAEVFQFDELETTFFNPSPEYVQDSVVGPERAAVSQWVKKNRGKPVYMITGIKIARGAQHLRSGVRGINFEFKPGVDATPFTGVPVSGGPLAGAGRMKGDATWFSNSSDFVFAYRLRRIIIKRQVVAKEKDYVRGAVVLHQGQEKDESPARGVPVPKKVGDHDMLIQSVDHSRSDYGSSGYHLDGFHSVEVRDEQDDENCLLQIPEAMMHV